MYSNEEMKNNIFSKLIGDGGLSSDFQPDSACSTGNYATKSYNAGMQQILVRIKNDDVFFDNIADKIIAKYLEICKLRGIAPDKYFDKVMTPYECCSLARFYGLQMLDSERNANDVRGR